MSDRINGFIVILNKSYRDDDLEATINAIKQIKGVIKVTPQVEDITFIMAKTQSKRELREKLYKVLED